MVPSAVLRLTRDKSKERYSLVLKVNGENTLEKEHLPDFSCQKWILEPSGGPWEIRGYYLRMGYEEFRVASVAESQRLAFNYGYNVGTITMTVFREQKTKPSVAPEELEKYEKELVLKKLPVLRDRPDNYDALKAQLLDLANAEAPRGLIVPGTYKDAKVETVSFRADPNAIMSLTIVYRK